MRRHRVAHSALDSVNRLLELRVLERLDLAAVVTHEVVMVLSRREHGLVAGSTGADVDPLHETLLAKQIEDAVNARDADGAPLVPEPVEDLLRRQAAVLAAQQLDDGAPGASAPVARNPERRQGRLGPCAHWRR